MQTFQGITQGVIFKVWSLDNYTSFQHHLRTHYKYKFTGHTQAYWIRNSGV